MKHSKPAGKLENLGAFRKRLKRGRISENKTGQRKGKWSKKTGWDVHSLYSTLSHGWKWPESRKKRSNFYVNNCVHLLGGEAETQTGVWTWSVKKVAAFGERISATSVWLSQLWCSLSESPEEEVLTSRVDTEESAGSASECSGCEKNMANRGSRVSNWCQQGFRLKRFPSWSCPENHNYWGPK